MAAPGCRRDSVSEDEPPDAGPPPPTGIIDPPSKPDRYEITDHIDGCELFHAGLVIDLGTPSARAREDYVLAPAPTEPQVVDREGAQFLRVDQRRLSFDFWLDHGQRSVDIRSRVHGGLAKGLTFFVDGHRIGSARLHDGVSETVSVGANEFELTGGRHTLTLHFWGVGRVHEKRPLVELDWINIGDPDSQVTGTYDAPTARKVSVDVDIDGRPRRSIVLQAPSTLRCPIVPAADADLRVSLGFWGMGSGQAEVRFSSENDPTVSKQTRRVRGGRGATWVPVEVSLRPHAGHLGMLELRALQSSSAGRVVFGDPAIVRHEANTERVPRVRAVVLVIAAGLDRRRIPPWGPVGRLTALGELSRTAVGYSGYRTPTSTPSGVVATLLTGVPPHVHKLDDTAARLHPSAKLLSTLIKQAGGRAAMFTGVPSTFPAFGFDVGWDRYEAYSPVKDIAATEPLDQATSWLRSQLGSQQSTPILVVVHTRGAHPPWDLTRDEVRALPPEEYGGTLDARRGGIELAKIRGDDGKRRGRLTQQDWTRLHGLMDAAMVKQSKALSRLLEAVERADPSDDVMVVFVGDVAVGNPPSPPFDPVGQLREDQLIAPLLIRFPGGNLGGRTVPSHVTTTDVTTTLLEALGLAVPERVEGEDLFRVASGAESLVGRPLVATLDNRYAAKFGAWLLRGHLGKTPRLYRTDVDPACLSDVFDQESHAAFALWYKTLKALGSPAEGTAALQREPASLDPGTLAALTVWGDLP